MDNVLIDFGGITSFDEPEINNILIYPNPFKTSAILHSDRFLSDASIQVYNLYGQLVKQMDGVSGQTITLQRDNLKNGMYLIRIIQNGIIVMEDKLFIID